MRGVDIKSVLASNSAESAEVAALEEEMATELAKEAGDRGKGDAQGSPDLDGGPSITPTPSKRAEIDRYSRGHSIYQQLSYPMYSVASTWQKLV